MRILKGALCCLLSAALLFGTVGCGKDPDAPTETTEERTLPTVDEEKTPFELLQEAANKTKGLTAFSIDYGYILDQERLHLSGAVELRPDGTLSASTVTQTWSTDGSKNAPVFRNYDGTKCHEWVGEEDGTTGSGDTPYTLSQIFSDMTLLSERTDLISLFATFPMTVSPSEDGSLCYQLTDLNREGFSRLVFGTPDAVFPEEGEIPYEAAITVHPEGILSRLEFRSAYVKVSLEIVSQEE
jgi:hypothetical protein